MTISNQPPQNELINTTEVTALVLEMIGCFAENTDKEYWHNKAFAIGELAIEHSRRLRAIQGQIGDLEDKAYEFDLMNEDAKRS